ASFPLVVAMINSFSVGLFVNCFGRYNSLLIVNLLAIMGESLMGFSRLAESVEVLNRSQLVFGFCELCTGFVPVYIGGTSCSSSPSSSGIKVIFCYTIDGYTGAVPEIYCIIFEEIMQIRYSQLAAEKGPLW
ncbi:Solute carrier family 2, facilitated glucose transporter member 3, partial [Galemys pyrenaicus]